MSSVFKHETKDFTFSLRNDGALIIGLSFVLGSALETSLRTDRKDNVAGSLINYFAFQDEQAVQKLEITSFFDTIESHAAGLLSQYVLSAFYHTFIAHGDQREQLLEGLRYYVHAKHYKLLEQADPKPLLAKYKDDYNKIRTRYPEFLKELGDLTEKGRKLHLNMPLVASTGLVVYSTLNLNWYVYETSKLSEDRPEYLYAVDCRSSENFNTDVFVGRQKDCVSYVMDEQEKVYGLSYENILKKTQENELLRKMMTELEIVLNIKKDQRLEVQEQKIDYSEQEQAALQQNLTRLHAYASMNK